MEPHVGARSVGARVMRVEDPRILTGRGRYVDDIVLPGMLHAAFLRSHVPHGRLRSVDASGARDLPGVVAVYTGQDIQHLTTAAIVNAIEDALAPFGARVREQHLPPTRILELAGTI